MRRCFTQTTTLVQHKDLKQIQNILYESSDESIFDLARHCTPGSLAKRMLLLILLEIS